ncbi:MAG TPA: FtsX-like permease family protein [Tepidisphaeraceae bacterium]|jgi:putative ABC transport system permease protein
MTIPQYVCFARRESRRSLGRIILFILCIAIGVAAIVVVAGLSDGVREGVRAEGRRLMAADLTIEGRRPLPAELSGIVARFAAEEPRFGGATVERADVREFASVVLAPDKPDASRLAEIKVPEGGYPLYGQLELSPAQPLQTLLTPDSVVVAQELLTSLGLKMGDALQIGGVRFRVAGVVVREPDKLSVSFTLGPRVFLSAEGLARTALTDRGARVEYRAMLKLPPAATGDDAGRLARRIEAELPDADFFRTRIFSDAQPALRRTFDRMGRYLGLVGLLSLLVGGLGVAQVARAWLAGRMDDIAVLRCIGLTPRQVVILFTVQIVVLATLASVIGAALGVALHALTPRIIGDLLPPELIRPWQPAAIIRGMLLGLAVTLVFTLPMLIGLRRVPPVRVFRRDAEPSRDGWAAQGLAAVLILAGIWAAAAGQSESAWYGTLFTGGLIATTLCLALAALGVSRITRLLPRDSGGIRLRHGLAHLARPGAATVGAIVALGLGVTFVFATRIVERQLGDQLRSELPADAPSTFFVDIQTDQWPQLEALLKQERATGINSQPIVTARFAAVDGVPITAGREPVDPVEPAGREERSRRPPRNLTREQRITYGSELPRGNRVVSGAFPAGPAIPNGVSVEEGFARQARLSIGSTITLDVQGVPVDLKVTSLRTIDWRTFGINFFLFAEPGPLNDAPQLRVAVARLPTADLARVQTRIVSTMPNVTVIHIRDVMDKVLAVLGNISIAVRALGWFIVAAGIIVLGGAVVATQARRAREVALLKTIGMTRRDVATVFAIEYALTGTVAAVVGVAAGTLLAWAVVAQTMDLPWRMPYLDMVAGVAVTVLLAVVAGLTASARALAVRPVEVLRAT